MQTHFDIAADLDTPVSAYLKLRPFSPRFLLESVEGGERIGRYSFIGFGEGLEIRTRSGDPAPALDRPLDLLRDALPRTPRLSPTLDGVPFQGGLVGAAGFDLHELAFFAPCSILAFDHVTRRAALLHDGDENERASLRMEVIRALQGPIPKSNGLRRYAKPTPSMTQTEFLSAVSHGQESIRRGDVYQVVLSIRYSGETDMEPFQVYRALRLLNPSPYLFFCQFEDLSIIGSSPEALVTLQGRAATLRPIAGTRPRSADVRRDSQLERELLADSKEAAEHVMLVDLARSDLGRVAVPGTVSVNPFRAIERYSHVMHLVSGVEGVLAPEFDAFDLFSAAFPAGTVVGAPKKKARELIAALEPVDRGVYAGTVGYFGTGGTMDQAIAIRTIMMHPGGYAFQAGAGIVADSIPEREHDEIQAKSAALRGALQMAAEGL